MHMASLVYRVHPAIGVCRVGNSEEYNLAPETMTGLPVPSDAAVTGGLPIRAGTESDHITSADVRSDDGALKRQAVRFRIFCYPDDTKGAWPSGAGTEVCIGTEIDGKKVRDITWTVHVANKKANTFVLVENEDQAQGIASYSDGRLPPIRNAGFASTSGNGAGGDPIAILNDPARVRALTIDPGPRAILGSAKDPVGLDAATAASRGDAATGKIVALKNYPKSFPGDAFGQLDSPAGPIDTLGQLHTDQQGRLIVVGGYGKASGWYVNGARPMLDDDVNNDQWFDDASDGPVSAVVVFDDGSTAEVHGAWVTTTDPGFAPQILNVVSLWDDLYDAWVRLLGLVPEIYDESKDGYQASYQPTFDDQIAPIFRAAQLAQWTVNLSPHGQSYHATLAGITAGTDPATTELAGLTAIFRNPFEDQYSNTTLMPLALGDANQPMLALRRTQYFFLQRWNTGRDGFRAGSGLALGPGESLDKASLTNCLGGRFSPGIDLTFPVREPQLYQQDWRDTGAGPFRVLAKSLDYGQTRADRPFLTAGYVPRHVEAGGLEPGDLSKFMAIPWHTDYNSCATHPPSPNPPGNATLFWSWPAQRPVAVFTAEDVTWTPGDLSKPVLGGQRWSVRGPGTDSTEPQNWGRFQPPVRQMLENWQNIGVVLQGAAIESAGPPYPPDSFLETGSRLVDTGRTPVAPFPNLNASALDERTLFYQLMNVDDYPEVPGQARAYVDYWLKWAEAFSNDPAQSADQQFFPYTEEAFTERLNFIYEELVDAAANQSDPGTDPPFTTRDAMVQRVIQMAPFNLTDGAWLRNIGNAGPIDEVRSLLFSILMDELGDGDLSRNHCNIYLDMCHSVGYYPPPINTAEFAFDPQLLRSGFTVPAFELAISQFSADYYPEILGMTLMLEWEVLDLKPTRDLFQYFGINPHFYVMHIGIDNAVNGHGQRAADAVRFYLREIGASGGPTAVQAAWRRIWNGFVAFGNAGTFGNDLNDLLTKGTSLRDQVLAMIERKASYGSLNHQQHMVGPIHIDEWFADPPGFLDALVKHDWITPGNWAESRLRQQMDFETGQMFRVFTDDEIQLWADYTASLAQPPSPPPPPTVQAAQAMAALIDELRPVQSGISGHQTRMMADEKGEVHTIAWWFSQPTAAIMLALVSPFNELTVAGHPEQSRFFTELIAPNGPMGPVFGLPASVLPDQAVGATRRDVVASWILAGCPLIDTLHISLALNTPAARRAIHPTGIIHGMGTIH
jgi:L-Lysine epsilon oxidase N-terminal/L-lysine epsilon oxidase C-terminal domain/Iron-containing redox enzyme